MSFKDSILKVVKKADDELREKVKEFKAEQKEKREFKKSLKRDEYENIERLKSQARIRKAVREYATDPQDKPEKRITSGIPKLDEIEKGYG